MTSDEIRCIAKVGDVCGEGAVWHAAHNAVYWTDINRGLLHRYQLSSDHLQTWKFDQPVTALTLTTNSDTLLVLLGGVVLLWNPDEDRRENELYRLPSWPAARCNDARVDPAGVLWFGTMQNNIAQNGSTIPVTKHVGELLSVNAFGEIRHWQSELGIPNTVAWTPGEETMLFGDTLQNTIYSFKYNKETQSISHRGVFCTDFERGLPDGSAMDVEGYLWNCRYGGGCIVRFAPDGSVDRVIDVPIPNPTTCAFGGPDLKTLYFTSAGEDRQIAGVIDGGLFCIPTEVAGVPGTPFRLRS
jgi:sugar lactone lactonase YvrE